MDEEQQPEPVVERFAAFDVGDKRIGVALSDALGNAQPLLTVWRKTPRSDLKSIARLLRKHGVTEAVVGYPLNLSGDAGPRALKAEQFAEQMRAEFGIPVHLADERLTTWAAHELLNEAGRRPRTIAERRERSRIVDQVAAVLILEGWLQVRAQAATRHR
jgi:putative Holliday junction resolvase